MTRPTRLVPMLLLLTSALVLSACANSLVSDGMARVTPYRVEIVQGNVITREQIEAVKPGMTREQVRDALGAPLLTDVFHGERWDYVFTLRRQGLEQQRRSVVAWFERDTLKKVEAPTDLPSEVEFVAGITRSNSSKPTTKLVLTDEERSALPVPTKTEPVAATAAASAPARTYPPLEPAK